MISVEQLLQTHSTRYPKMQPSDAVKLLYQRVFGGGHLIRSERDVAAYIKQEAADVKTCGEHRTEFLGETARVYLDSSYSEGELELLARVFCISAERFCSGWESADGAVREEWETSLDVLRREAEENRFAFSAEDLEEYLTAYRAQGYPAVRHSQVYREAYAPAYRVIDSRFVRILPVLNRIAEKLRTQKRVIVSIDGRCASGKTTAAQMIARIFDAEIIHMDDFFLPGPMRTPQRMQEVGGNLHRERFMEEVLPHLRFGSFSYRVFRCSTFTYAEEPRTIGEAPLVLCEGSYALHPEFGDYCDIAVFSDVPPDEQLERIRLRDGEYMLSRFQKEWIPMEERYFTEMNVRARCDFIV